MIVLESLFNASVPYVKMIDAACVKYGYSQLRTYTQIGAESAFGANEVSPTGALGLCQIEPATAADWGCDPNDPESSINALVVHMRDYTNTYAQNDKYFKAPPFNLALAAYNAGPGAVDDYENVPPYPETQNYVTQITQTCISYAPRWVNMWKGLLARAGQT